MTTVNFVPLEGLHRSRSACMPVEMPPVPAASRTVRAPEGHYFNRQLKLFEFEGTSLLFDVEGFRLFSVTREVVEFLRAAGWLDAPPAREPVAVPHVEGSDEALTFLLASGLVSRERTAPEAVAPTAPAPIGLTLHVNHFCNLRCVYCYADGGTYGGSPVAMSREVMTRAIDVFLDVCHPRLASIHWFGGEPLLSFDAVREGTLYAEARAKAAGKPLSFSITSNGTIIDDERAAFLAEHGIGVTISCDGTPEVHDELRPRADGKGSYADLTRGLAALRRHGVSYGLRATATRDRMNVEAQIHHLGSLEPGDGVDLQFDLQVTRDGNALTADEVVRLRREYRAVADRLISGEDSAPLQKYVGLADMARAIVTKNRKQRGCMAGTSSFAVHPEGHVYPCHRFVSDERFRLGNVLHGFRFEVQAPFLNATVGNREPCASCWARHLCGGACYNICSENADDIRKPPEFYCQNMMAKAAEAVRIVWNAARRADDATSGPASD